MNPAPSIGKQIGAGGALIIATAIWGFTFILIKWTVAVTDVYYFLFLRFFCAALLLSLFFPLRLHKGGWPTIRAAFLLSIFMGGAYITQTEGLRFTSATNSALITGIYLVLIPAISAIWFRQFPRRWSVVGAVIALGGLYLLTQGSLSGINRGDLLTLGCAFSWSFHFILTGKYANRHPLVPLVVWQFFFIAFFSALVSVAKGSFGQALPEIAIQTILTTALLATALAFLIQVAAQRVLDPTRTGVIVALEGVFGALFAWWLGGETLTAISLFGAFCMVAGMLISELSALARGRKRSHSRAASLQQVEKQAGQGVASLPLSAAAAMAKAASTDPSKKI